MNDTIILIFVTILLVLSIVGGLVGIGILGMLSKLSDMGLTNMMTTKSIMERLWKVESMVGNLGLMESLTGELNNSLGQDEKGVIIASSADEFFSKMKQDPNIHMTPQQIDELRQLFERNLNDEDGEDEPWKRP